MAIAIDPEGHRYHFSVPYSGERFQVTRYGNIESHKIDHVVIKDSVSGDSITADEEDAEQIDGLCAALNAGEIPIARLEEKLNWYFEATSQ